MKYKHLTINIEQIKHKAYKINFISEGIIISKYIRYCLDNPEFIKKYKESKNITKQG